MLEALATQFVGHAVEDEQQLSFLAAWLEVCRGFVVLDGCEEITGCIVVLFACFVFFFQYLLYLLVCETAVAACYGMQDFVVLDFGFFVYLE